MIKQHASMKKTAGQAVNDGGETPRLRDSLKQKIAGIIKFS
jgi:hypothetical protein